MGWGRVSGTQALTAEHWRDSAMQWITLTLELDLLGSNPNPASGHLCGFGQVIHPL